MKYHRLRAGWLLAGLSAIALCLGWWRAATLRKSPDVTASTPGFISPNETQESVVEVEVQNGQARTEVMVSPESSAIEAGDGTLEVVDLVGGGPWNGALTADSGDGKELQIPVVDGTAAIPQGAWSLRAENGWTFDPDIIDVVGKEDAAVTYAIKKRRLRFVILDQELAPIEGVIARFEPKVTEASSPTAVSQADGRLEFEKPCIPFGRVYFEKAGYRPAIQRISGFIAEEITIVLSSESYLGVKLVACDDASLSLEGVVAKTHDGSQTLGVSDHEGRLPLGKSIIDAEDVLKLTGACFPSSVVIGRLGSLMSNGAVCVPRVSRGTVTLSGTTANHAFFEIVGSDSSQGAVPFDFQVSAREGAGWSVTMPRGVRANISVRTDNGECGTIPFEAGPDGWLVEIMPDLRDVLEIQLFLDDGPAGEVRATAMYAGRLIAIGPEPGSLMEFEVPRVELSGVDGILRVPFCSRVGALWIDVPGAERVTLSPFGNGNRAGVLRLDLMPAVQASFEVYCDNKPLSGVGLQLESQRSGMSKYPERGGGWPTSHPSWTLRGAPSSVRTTDRQGLASFDVSPGYYQAWLADAQGYWSFDGLLALEGAVWSGELDEGSLVRIKTPCPTLVGVEVWNGQTNLPTERFEVHVQSTRVASVGGCYWEGLLPNYLTYLDVVIADVGRSTVYLDKGAKAQHHDVTVLPTGAIPIVVKGWQEHELGLRSIRVTFLSSAKGRGDEYAGDAIVTIDSSGNGGLVPPQWPVSSIRFNALDHSGRTIEFDPESIAWPTSVLRLNCRWDDEQP